MLTICWIASSCPMIILRRPVSRVLASRPVFAGSNGTFSRTILSAAFLLGEPFCRSAPRHKFSGNPSDISLDAPQLVAILSLVISSAWTASLLHGLLRFFLAFSLKFVLFRQYPRDGSSNRIPNRYRGPKIRGRRFPA